MVNQSSEEFEVFATSLFRLTRSLRTTAHLWVQLPGGLKRTDVTILKVLHDQGDARPGLIAERLGVGASVISRQLVSLVSDGLVERRKDPADGRAELIRLTPEGRDRLAALREAYVRGMREHFTDWDGETARRAAELLDEISDHIVPALGGPAPAPSATTTPSPTPDDDPDDTDDTDDDTKDLHV